MAPLASAATDLLPAREQMAFTLGTHIILASLGVAFPAITLIANWRGWKKGDADAMVLARRWSKVMALTFAVGAVTGTVLSFEMGLLWPGLLSRYGAVFGIPFAIEGIFFFLEATFIAIYLFGWTRLSARAHFWTGVPIVISGLGGALSVVAANSWMNQPTGFTVANGKVTHVDPLAAIFNNATPYEVPHMILAAYMLTGFLVASVYAVGMLRGRLDRHHRIGFLIPFVVAAAVTPLQLLVGDTAARSVAHDQPAKFAGIECVQQTSSDVTEYIGGVCTATGVKGGIGIPGLDSLLVGFSTSTRVTGLDSFPPEDRPPANTLLHLAFDAMVGIGTALLALGAWLAVAWLRTRRLPRSRWFLRLSAAAGAATVVALECGWIVTEVGRQPWIVYNVLRTNDAVTTAGGIPVMFAAIVLLYVALGAGTVLVLRALARRWRSGEVPDEGVPYGPASPPNGTPA